MDARKATAPPSSSSPSSDNHHLPWFCVIEALAESRLVDTSLLDDLISRASELTDESFIENARERLSLNQLEDFITNSESPNNNNNSLTFNHSKKIGIDVSERAHDVLNRLLANMEISNMRMSMLESLKSDVCQFILHKRARFTRCDLQQLKSTILEGVHPSASSLREISGLDKEDRLDEIIDRDAPNAAILQADNSSPILLRGRSGLDKEDQRGNIISVDDGDPYAGEPKENSCHLGPENGNRLLEEYSTGKGLLSGRRVPEQIQIQCLGERGIGSDTVNIVAESLEPSLKDGEVHLEKQNTVPSVPETTNEIVQEDPPDSRKKEMSRSENEQVQCFDRGTSCVDIGNHHSGANNLKNIELKSLGQEVAPCHGNEPVQDPSGRILTGDKEVSDLQGDGNSLDDDDGGNEFDGLKRLKQGNNDCEVQHNESQFSSRDGKIPQEAHPNGHHQDNYINDGNLDKAPSFDSDEEMVIAAEKHSFLSSQNTFNQDSQATAEWTEGSFCIKCNKGGQLLTCCASTCVLVFHESCVGSSVSVSDSGNFYCPFCLYVQAIAEYRETKKKADLVKKKVEFARSHLSGFMCMVNAQRQQQPSEMAPKEDLLKSRMVGDSREMAPKEDLLESRMVGDSREADFLNEHDNILQRERVNNQPMQVADIALECNSFPPGGEPKSPLSDRNIAKAREEDLQEQDIVQPNQKVVEGQELAEPRTAHHSDDLPQRVEETTLNCKKMLDVLLTEERTKTELNEDHPSVLEERKHVKAQRKRKTAKLPCSNAETESAHQKHADVEKEIEDWQYTADRHRGPSCQQNVNANEVTENRNGDGISSSLRKRERLATQHSNSARRKKTVWSAEEEEILKEGVCRFTSSDDKNVPWKKILEFGSHVFKKSRTTIDLKDKWRNISSKEDGK